MKTIDEEFAMKKVKTLLVSLLMLIVGCAGGVLYACGENNDNMTISLSTSHVEIILGENDNTATLYATVENAVDKKVSVECDSKSIQVSVKEPSSDGISEITVKALRQCQNIDVSVIGAKKSTSFTVTAIQPVTAITPNQNTYPLSYSFQDGGSLTFTNDMFTISPEGTNQTQLTYHLVSEIQGVSIENNTLTIEPRLSNLPQEIAVEVVPANRDNVRETFSVTVVKAIDVSNVLIVDGAGANLSNVEISRTSTTSTIATIYVRVPYSVTREKLDVTPVFAYNDKGIFLDNSTSYPVDGGAYYEYAFDFTVLSENSSVGTDRVWFVLSYTNYPEFKYSTSNAQNGVVTISVVDEIRDISVTSDGIIIDTENSIDIFTTYVSGSVQGYALTFSAIPSTATSSQLSLNISAVDRNYLIVRDGRGNVVEFTDNKYLFNSGDTFYFMARAGFDIGDTVTVIVKSEKENVNVQKTLTMSLKEGVTSLGFVNSTGDGVESSRQYYLDTAEHSVLNVKVAVAPASIDLTTLKSVEIYSTSDAFEIGQITNTNQTLNGANIYSIELLAQSEGSGELVISFISGQIIRANVSVIKNLSDVSIGIDSNFAISSAIGDLRYDGESLSYVALKYGQTLPLTFTGDAEIESVSFNFVDYVYDSEVDNVYDENGAYVNFGKNQPGDEAFTANTSKVISANYLRALNHISPINVGKVWIRATFSGKQIIEQNGEYFYTDVQISKYLLVEIYNPIVSIEIDAKEVSLYPADELGQENQALSQQIITLTVNRGTALPTYDLIEVDGMVDGLYQYFINGVVNFEVERLNSYQFLVSALTRNDDGTDGIGESEFESATIDFVSRDLNLERNKYSITVAVTMKKPQLVEKVVIGNVGSDGIYLEAPNLTSDISLTSFKLAVSVSPNNALNQGVVYRFIPDSGTLSTIITISDDGLITTSGMLGGSGTIRVIPKDSVFVDENGHEYYRDEYVYAEVDILVADGRTRETALRISDLSEVKHQELHYILLNNTSYSSTNQLFASFSGGLYGSVLEGSQDVVTISLSGSNLFGALLPNATISDINIVGNVTASSMLVDINQGTIKNVTVNVDIKGDEILPSSVSATDNAGGIAQENYGTIENVTFAGNITSTKEDAIVGGIVAINNGEISHSKVLFYNFEGDTTTTLRGSVVGAIVGELKGQGRIEYSYAYNFSKKEILASQNVGAIVGIISSTDAKIVNCFAEIGNVGDFYAKLVDVTKEDLTSIIKDSYTTAKTTDTEYVFTYYMTNALRKTIAGSYSSTEQQNYPSVDMSSSVAIWRDTNKSVNHGFPYLYALVPPSSITSEQLKSLTITNSRLSLAENGGEALMFLYSASGINLTNREQQLLTAINTISYGEIFGTYSLGGLVVTSSDTTVISTTSNSLIVKNVGTTTLTISSLYDFSVGSRQVVVTVIYYSSPLVLTYNGQNLGSSSTINVRTSVNETLTSSLESSIVLVDRQISLKQNNYDVRFVQSESGENVGFIIGSKLGTHTVVGDFEQDQVNVNIYLSLDGLSQNNLDSLKNYTQKTITLNKIYGPISLVSSVSQATISASDYLSVNVEITSDTKYLETINSELVIEILNGDGEELTTDDILYDINLIGEIKNNATTIRTYQVSIRLNTSLSTFDNNYTVVFKADGPSEYYDITATLDLTVLEQEVLRVDVNHYAYRGSGAISGVSLFDYYPNNVLSPNSIGLLDIMLYPSYSKYTHITVTSEPQNGYELSFLNMKKNGQGYSVNLASTFEYITNGIQIYKVDAESEVARYFVRVKVPEGVAVDTVYTIYVNVYNNDEVVYSLPYSLIIVPQEKAGITVNGESSIYAIRGETITADIIWDMTQNIESITAFALRSSTDPNADSSVDTIVANDVYLPSNISDADREEYGTSYYRASIDITVGEDAGNFRVRVDTSRTINGVKETVYSYLIVYVIDFELDFENTHIANEDGSDVAIGDQYFYHTLEFNFGGRYVEGGASEEAYNTFVAQNYYANDDYIVNIGGAQHSSLLYNLYYVNGKTYTPVMNSAGNISSPSGTIVNFIEDVNGDVRFIGTQNGTQNMMLQMRVQMPDLTIYTYTYFFSIVISDPTSEDSPAQISSAEDFTKALNAENEDDYILTQDIYLYEYTPASDTSKIRSLDGNGYQIVIMSFNYDNTQSQINLALFNTVSANTTLKNLRVNVFHLNTISLNSAYTKTVNIAPIAITNNGIITNCEVVSFRALTNEIAPAVSGLSVEIDSTIGVSAITAGFVVTNNGIITNSRVGGESAVEYIYDIQIVNGQIQNTGAVTPKTHVLSPFVISSFGEIAGFVSNNSSSGHIVSSYASNMRIINNSNIDYTTVTAGFAIENAGLISASYAKGVKEDDADVHATLYGIETSGISAGFVYENSGEINNSYSNITLTNQNNNPGRNSAGFVYRNTNTGVIETSLSLSRIVGSTTTQMNFAGVDDYGNYQNLGEITNSYYYDEVSLSDSSILIESAYGEGAKYISNVKNESYLYGFSFAHLSNLDFDDGIWMMTSAGPELVSANQIAVSLRYVKNISTSAKPMFTYVDEFRYGSKNNPILIRSAEEFASVFSGTNNTSASRYVNTTTGEIFGSYRLIKDIDLSELVTDSNNTYTLASSSMTLTGKYKDEGNQGSIGKFDGNGLTISGLALSDPEGNAINFGMFASVTDGAIVQNVNLVLGSTNASGDVFGVEASGVEYVGALSGTVENSTITNVSLTSAFPDTNSVTVRGRNVVGGLVGRVIGDSYIFNLSVESVSVTASMNPTNYVSNSYISYNTYNRTSDILNAYISYAGGVVGIIDAYGEGSINVTTYAESEVSSDGNAVMLKTLGTSIISGGTVGGVTGYVGPLTVLQDALYELSYVDSTDYTKQGIYSYNGFAGGIVGYNAGYIRQVRSEHEKTWQIGDDDPNDAGDDSIEANIKNYYQGDYSVDRGNTTLFMTQGYTPIAIGGLVGLQVSGKIEKSYSKLNVINTNTQNSLSGGVYAGGIVGLSEMSSNPDTYVETNIVEVYASGDVQSRYASGIVGLARASMSLDKVNAINYWGNWLADESEGQANAVIQVDSKVEDVNNIDLTYTYVVSFNKDNIVFKNGDTNIAISDTKYIDDENGGSELPSFASTITGFGDDGANYSVFFTGNKWDINSWDRDENELFPHILFGYASNIQYIRTQSDIERLRTAGEDDVFVIDPDLNDVNNVITSSAHYIGITEPIEPITSFSGTLRGLDNRYEYGFVFRGVTQTKSIFLNTANATFSNFTISFEEGASFESANISQNAILVTNASNTTFTDLSFVNVNAKISTLTSRFGLVTSMARGITTFRNISITSSQITYEASAGASNTLQSSLYVGLVFGDSQFTSGGGVSSINIQNCAIIFNDIKNSDVNSFSVGLVGGRFASNSQSTISINGSQDSESEFGISDSTIQFKSQSKDSTVYGLNMGMLFGSADNAVISSMGLKVDLSAESGVKFVNSYIGGIIGYSQNVTLDKIDIDVLIDISSQNSNIGGILGYGKTTSLSEDAKIVVNNSTKDDDVFGINVTSLSLLREDYGNSVGSLFGSLENASLNNGNKHSMQSLIDVTLSGSGRYAYIGGIVGKMDGSLYGAESYGDIILRATNGTNSYSVYAGGIAGNVDGESTLGSCFSFGDFKHIVEENNNQEIVNSSDYSKVSLVLSGIAGVVNGQNVILEQNISAGNFYPSYEESGDKSTPNTKSISKVLNNLTYGGIIGVVSSEGTTAYIENNTSIATLFNRYDRALVNDSYIANALVGSGKVSNAADTSTNYYAHVATLCTDSLGTNVAYGNILDNLNGGIKSVIGFDENNEENNEYIQILYRGETGGTKLNPSNSFNRPSINNNETWYTRLSDDTTGGVNKIGDLVNTVVIGDGAYLTFSNNNIPKDAKSISSISPISSIDKNSSVSGVVVVANFVIDSKNSSGVNSSNEIPVAGLTYSNNGIIYSCNVSRSNEINSSLDTTISTIESTSTNPQKLVGIIDAGKAPIAGLVGINTGLIKDSFVSLNITTTYAGSNDNTYVGHPDNESQKQDVAAAGLVGTNDGVIVNSYSSGNIDAENAVKSEGSNLYVYLVSAGTVYDSYTNMRVVFGVDKEISGSNMKNNYSIYAYDSESETVINCYYDSVAAEFYIQGAGTGSLTNALSVNYTGTMPTTKIGTFSYDKEYAYGYGSFSGGAYQDIDYMHHETGKGTLDNPFQIPNLGKLGQLDTLPKSSDTPSETSPATQTYFNLINDINGSYVSQSTLKWSSLEDIQNIVLDGYDTLEGYTHSISNLNVTGGGIFNVTTNCIFKNLVIDNLSPTIQNKNYIVGLIANIAKSSVITNIKVTGVNPEIYQFVQSENGETYYYGNIVGQLGEGSKLSECSATSPDITNDNDSVALNIVDFNKFVYGGIVGHVTNGATVTNCDVGKELIISFRNKPTVDETIVVGGVVGLLEDGTVSNAYLSNSMYVLSDIVYANDSFNTQHCDKNITLYVGGIVGYVGSLNGEEVSTTKSDIINSALLSKAEIYAGNPYNISTCYVGGISGFGGRIEDCYNNASNIVANAKYNYDSLSDSYENDDDITDWESENAIKSYNVYTSSIDDNLFNHYDKLVYTKVSQHAYAAGIANNYNYINRVSNNCENVYGGIEARKVLAYYDVDSEPLAYMSYALLGALYAWLTSMFHYNFYPYVAVLVASIFVNVDVDAYYAEGSGFDAQLMSDYYPDIHRGVMDMWENFDLLSIIKSFVIAPGTFIFKSETVEGLDFTLGNPKLNPQNKSIIKEYISKLRDGEQWMGLGVYNNYIYNTHENFDGNNREDLYVYNVYFHPIGKEAENDGDTGSNVAWKKDVFYQPNDTNDVTDSFGSRNLYSLNDISMKDSDYKYLFKTPQSVIDSISTVGTGNQPNAWSSDVAWDGGWEYIDGNIVINNSPEYASTSYEQLFNNNTSASGSEEDAEATIEVKSLEDYRGTVKFVNNILKYTSSEAIASSDFDTLNDSEKFASLVYAIKETGQITIALDFVGNSISFGSSVSGFGVDERHPFSGTITSSNYEQAEITEFLVADTEQSKSIGLVSYGKNVTISDINLSYHTQQESIALLDKSMGGLIGTVVDGGEITITNTDVSLHIRDYDQGQKTSIRKQNIGGFIGKIENGNVIIQNSKVELSTDLTGTGNASQTAQTGIGGLVGYANETSISLDGIVSINLFDDGIVSTSANTTVGGAIGYMENSTILGENAELDITGKIDVENTYSDSVYAGGLVGYFDNSDTKDAIKLSEISIDLDSIEATAGISGTSTYAGGVIGYSNQNTYLPISTQTTLNIGSTAHKLIITSGVNGTEYSEYAYADNFIGNRGSGYEWLGTSNVQTSVLAMAKPSYAVDENSQMLKPSDDLLINSAQVVGKIAKNSTGEVSYAKIDMYEYQTQVDTKMSNAYVNGEQYTVYNYKKDIYIVISNGNVYKDAYYDDDVHNIEESIYKFEIKGYRFDNSRISDIVTDASIQFVCAYEYNITSDIYQKAIKDGAEIPMSLRGDNFVLKSGDFKFLIEKVSTSQISADGNSYIDTKKEYVKADNEDRAESISEKYSLLDDKTLLLNLEIQSINFDTSSMEVESNSIIYESIDIINKSLVLTYRTLSSKNNAAPSYSDPKSIEIYKQKNGGIYEDLQSSGKNKVSLNFTNEDGSETDIEGIVSTTNSELYIKLPDGKENYIENARIDSSSYDYVRDDSQDVSVTVGNLISIDDFKQYKPLFISIYNGRTENNNNQTVYLYQEHIMLIDNSGNSLSAYYLGSISYSADQLIEFKDAMARNFMFFPTQDANIMSYENNLLSLDKIKNVNDIDLRDVISFEIKTTKTDTSYYIDAASPDNLSKIMEHTVTQNSTYKVYFDSIDIKSIRDISINFTFTANVGEKTIVDQEVRTANIIVNENSTWRSYTIKNTPVYSYQDLETPLNAVVLTMSKVEGATSDGGATTQIFVFNYTDGVLTDFVSYTDGFVFNNNRYIIQEGALGNEGDFSNSDTEDGNDFGVTVEIVDSDTLLTFINTIGDTAQTGYIKLSGTGYMFKYDKATNQLLVTKDNETYIFKYVDGNFVLIGHEVTISMDEGKYTISESYTQSDATITLSFNGLTNSVQLTDGQYVYYTASDSKDSAELIGQNFYYVFKDWLASYTTNGYIEVHTALSEEQAVAIFERQTLSKLETYTASDSSLDVEAQAFVDESNNTLIFVKQDGDWSLFKSGQDVYNDIKSTMTDMALSKNGSGVILLRVDSLLYDISNGYRFNMDDDLTAQSDYSDLLPLSTIYYYLYDNTYIDGELQSHSKVEWTYGNKQISLELDFGINIGDIKLIPFNQNYAVQLSEEQKVYYTLEGYLLEQIEGQILYVGEDVEVSTYKSLGVSVPGGVSVLQNNAKFTTEFGEERIVSEYVYVRHNLANDWYNGDNGLSDIGETTFTGTMSYIDGEGEDATIAEANATVVIKRDIVGDDGSGTFSFVETVTTTLDGVAGMDGNVGSVYSIQEYTWTFDTSTNLIQYFDTNSFSDVAPNYNRYSPYGIYISSDEIKGTDFASAVIVVGQSTFDVVFGNLSCTVEIQA